MRQLVGALWLLAACGPGTAVSNMGPGIDVAQFNQACAAASDCLAVTLHPCGCGCAEASIASSEQSKYQTASRAITCSAPITCAGDCAAPINSCTAGKCAVSF